MWHFLYNVLLILASPLILLILLAKKRCRRGLLQRWGFRRGVPLITAARGKSRQVIWIHAVSLGEVTAAVPLVRTLHTRFPNYRLVVSTVTETGREAVEQRLAGVAEHRYAPLDFPWTVAGAIRELNPILYLFIETELWPNLLRTLWQRGVPTILVNGRLSSRSFARQQPRLLRPFYRGLLRTISRCLMQSERDVERIIALGADPARVHRIGNIKFDQPLPQGKTEGPVLSRALLRLNGREELIVAGSTHPAEEEEVLAAYGMLLRDFPSLVLLLAPRHIERAPQVEAMVRSAGYSACRRSVLDQTDVAGFPNTGARVIILDTRGELANVYQFSVVSFVGGTFVSVGGHNLLEPAVWGKPVWFGPYTDHCMEIAELLTQAGGGKQARDATELARGIGELLGARESLRAMGEAARRVVMDNQGAVQRSLDIIEQVLSARGADAEPAIHASSLPFTAGGR